MVDWDYVQGAFLNEDDIDNEWFENPPHSHGPGKCPMCGENTTLRKGEFGKFYGCVTFPKCKGNRNFETKK